ncbi:tRNA threonylcarbamoyladenosine biosynthesis protein TsaE [Pirellulimonas nuda]|uniref:tRNA threonylcarbamoyladenosine biosynthesis protein TsaE n=1 Tax=Pirellulimonas nuda TaxID=2528009 RepID=A0A518DF27_9BACT|nr:tRNA (adenosine(37)-N6)-threonylcarbamoyltransferase complex ATPase subunit type 1 TsaE [Pirellulimonas nuda]QDU90060.1 tRNA threonylcarbamoyladenosine biosynthesis protein TsaE [Pirellulimonas nuda]
MATVLELADESDTERLGQRLAAELPAGRVVALIGPLGAGKTRLVQAVCRALGVAEDVTSPTFVLVNEYRSGRMPVFHFDAYRLRDDDEFLELGPEEYFAAGGLTFIEWGDRVQRCLPPGVVTIQIEPLEGDGRRVTINGV